MDLCKDGTGLSWCISSAAQRSVIRGRVKSGFRKWLLKFFPSLRFCDSKEPFSALQYVEGGHQGDPLYPFNAGMGTGWRCYFLEGPISVFFIVILSWAKMVGPSLLVGNSRQGVWSFCIWSSPWRAEAKGCLWGSVPAAVATSPFLKGDLGSTWQCSPVSLPASPHSFMEREAALLWSTLELGVSIRVPLKDGFRW